ncbi:MAG: phosphonate ABC transporter, permease protein PhnE [Nitriliruptorales bacterium]
MSAGTPTVVDAGPGRSTGERPRRPRRIPRDLLLTGLAAAVIWAALTIDVELRDLLRLPAGLVRVLRLMFFFPDWSYAGRAWEGMLESIQIAWIGTLIGALLSLPLGFLGARNVTARAGSGITRQVLNAIRAVPEIILAILFIPIIGLGAFAGTMAIGLHSIGTLGKLTSEVIEGVDTGPVEAAEATGGRRLDIMRWGVFPQVMPEIVAFWLYRFEINIRASAILGIVGAGGVGGILQNALSYRRWDKAGMTILVVIGATIVIDAISSRIRRRIIEGPGGMPAEATEGTMVGDPI